MRNIGLDFDDTLLPTRQALVTFLNARHGTSASVREMTEYRFRAPWFLTDEAFDEMFTSNFTYFHDIPPLPGVQETLREWQAEARFFIITGRPDSWIPPAIAWLKRYAIPYEAVISTPELTDKGRIAVAQNISLFVEDNGGPALAVAGSNIDVLLLDAPYNQDCSHPRVRRVRDWSEIRSTVSWPERTITC